MGASPPALIRAVLDTNTVVSALLFSGTASRLVSLWQRRGFAMLLSREILDEYLRVLAYPKFRLSEDEIRTLVEVNILPFARAVRVRTPLSGITRDPDDDKFLACALAGRARWVVTGDSDLLCVGPFRKVNIVTAGRFLTVLEKHIQQG